MLKNRAFLLAATVIVACVALVSAVIWLHRAEFLTPFEYAYVRNFYDHSHWSVPLSQRKMGDGLLYQIAGYELVTNNSFTEINPEAPPMGKYLIGWSILLTKSGAWVNVPLFFLLLTFSYFCARAFFKEEWQRWLTVFLIAWQPLVWQQLFQTTLDLGQVVWLTGWVLFVIALLSAKKPIQHLWPTVGAGLCLGFFISTKIAFFSGPLLLLVGGLLLFRKKQWWLLGSLLIAGAVYGSMYLPYLLATNIHATLSLQKWIMNYWLSSSSRAVPGITLLTLASGLYLGHWQGAKWQWLAIWHPTWMLGSFVIGWWLVKKKTLRTSSTPAQLTLLFCLAALVVSLSLVPLFERYLLLVIPFVSLTTVWLLTLLPQYQRKLLTGLLGWTILQTVILLPPSLSESVKEIERVAAVPSYQELWAFLDSGDQQQYDRNTFWHTAQTAHYQAGITATTWRIKTPLLASSWQTQVPIAIAISHQTPVGVVSYTQPAMLYRREGKWTVDWDWRLVLPEWQPNQTLTLEYTLQSSPLQTSTGVVVAESGMIPAIFVTPSSIQDELALNAQIERLTGMSKPQQELRYKVSQLPDLPQRIAPVLPYADFSAQTKLEPGLSVQMIPGRKYHPALAQNQELVTALIEAENNLQLKYQGTLTVDDPAQPQGKRVLLHRDVAPIAAMPVFPPQLLSNIETYLHEQTMEKTP